MVAVVHFGAEYLKFIVRNGPEFKALLPRFGNGKRGSQRATFKILAQFRVARFSIEFEQTFFATNLVKLCGSSS